MSAPPIFHIDDFDTSIALDVSGINTSIGAVSINQAGSIQYDVVVDCDISAELWQQAFFLLADSTVDLDDEAAGNTASLEYVYDPSGAAAIVNQLYKRGPNSIRAFKVDNSKNGNGYSDTAGPEDNVTSDATNGLTDISRPLGNGSTQVQADFMGHLSYRLLNNSRGADILQNSLEVSNDFREKFLESFGRGIVENSATLTSDVSYSLSFVDGTEEGAAVTTSEVFGEVSANAITFTDASGVAHEYLTSAASQKLYEKLATWSGENLDDADQNRYNMVESLSNLGQQSDVNGTRSRIGMMLRPTDKLAFTLRVDFAPNQLATVGLGLGRRTSRVYKIQVMLS